MLDLLLKRADFPEGSTFTADEVARWPSEALQRLLAAGLVREIDLASGVVCDQCEDACWIEPEIREQPATGKRVGMYFCPRHEDVGRFEVSLERLRQWQVHIPGLAAAVAKALSATGGVQEVVADRLHSLGRIALSGKSREVFLGRGLAWSDAIGVIAQAESLRAARAPIVLVPATVPAESVWSGRVPTVRPLTEVATISGNGLTIVAAHLMEERGAGGKAGKPREMLRGWKDICAHVGLPPDRRRSVKLLNETQGGPIRSLGRGKPPEVWNDDLLKWWEDQEGRHQTLQEKQKSSQATVSDSFVYGHKGETVIPKAAMYVRKRRKKKDNPPNDNL